MERDLQFQKFFAGGEVYGDGGVSPEMSMNGTLSFQSLLKLTNEPPSLYGGYYYPMPELTPEIYTPMPYPYIEETFQAENESSDIIHQKLKMPKIETAPFNFLTESTQVFPSFDSFTESASNSALQSLQFETSIAYRPYKKKSPTLSSTAARRRRSETISNKLRCLEKLLPCEKKMDRATMLQEAYKYVKFLKAQVTVLQSMPPDSIGGACTSDATSSTSEVSLKSLNRQQLLETVVNSRVAQSLFTSKGLCVFSTEQLPLVYNNIAHQTRIVLPWRST